MATKGNLVAMLFYYNHQEMDIRRMDVPAKVWDRSESTEIMK